MSHMFSVSVFVSVSISFFLSVSLSLSVQGEKRDITLLALTCFTTAAQTAACTIDVLSYTGVILSLQLVLYIIVIFIISFFCIILPLHL